MTLASPTGVAVGETKTEATPHGFGQAVRRDAGRPAGRQLCQVGQPGRRREDVDDKDRIDRGLGAMVMGVY